MLATAGTEEAIISGGITTTRVSNDDQTTTKSATDSLEFRNCVQSDEYDLEELFWYSGQYTLAGFHSAAERIFVAAGCGHLASSLFSNAIPQLNLLKQNGKDLYLQCLPASGIANLFSGQSSEHGVLNVRRIANIMGAANRGVEEEQFGVHCGAKYDARYGFGTQASTMNWSCSIKAKAAEKQGLSHEYEFYTLMCGKKHSNECLFTRNWYSHLYAHFYFYMRQKIDCEIEKHVKPNEQLMDLERAVTSSVNLQTYVQGKQIQSGNGWARAQTGNVDNHEQCLTQALSIHRHQGPVQEFFRTLQSALILKQYSQLLFEFGPRLKELISSLNPEINTMENSRRQIWLISFLDMLILLINTSHLQKAEMSTVQLLILDELLTCVLEILCEQHLVDLVPMYACHLKVAKQVEWYQRIMRSGTLHDESAKEWFLEAKYWLEQWHGFEKESFHRTDDIDSYEVSMTEVVYWNAREVCKDLTKGVNERELALWWLGIAIDEEKEDTKIQQLARDLYFSLFLEISFLHLPSAIEMHGHMLTALTASSEIQEEFVSFDHVTRKDLRNWMTYCMAKVDTSIFLNVAESCGLELTGVKTPDQKQFMERFLSIETQSIHQYLQMGKEIHTRLLDIVTSEFFYEPLMFNPFLDKHKIEFVVCKGIDERKAFIPFDNISISSVTESIEAFLNDILACHEHNAAASSFDSPLPGFITIRMEFKKEALVSSNMLNVITTFLKGQYKEANGISIAQFSAPLTLMKRIANAQTKASMIRDLMKIQGVIKVLEAMNEAQQESVLDILQDPCKVLMDRRSQLLGEEHVLNEVESMEFLKSEVNLKIADYIYRQF
eukprot:g4285.t1